MFKLFKKYNPIFYAIILIVLIAGLAMSSNYYVHHNPVENKFLKPWLGMRTFLELGSDPYGEPATQRTQLLYYGNFAQSGQDPLYLNQPFASVILFFPLALINDYNTARVVWMVLLEIILILSIYMLLLLFEWKPPTLVAIQLSILVVLGSQSLIPLIENDQVIFVLLFLLIGFISLQKGSDELSGAAFALALFRPSITGIACMMAFWWAIRNQRKRVIWGGLMTLGFLFLTSFGLFPGWLFSFLRAYRSEFEFVNYQSTFGILSAIWPTIGVRVAAVLTICIIVILFQEWRAASKKNFRWFLWVACLTLAAHPLLGLPTLPINNLVYLIPMTYIFKIFAERIGKRNRWFFISLITWMIFFGGWALTLSMKEFSNLKVFNLLSFIAPSILLIIGMYWIRWWATRPPRTWFDLIEMELS